MVRNGDEVVAVGAVGGEGRTYGLSHLVSSDSSHAAESVIAVLGSLEGESLVAIPGPHPGVPPSCSKAAGGSSTSICSLPRRMVWLIRCWSARTRG